MKRGRPPGNRPLWRTTRFDWDSHTNAIEAFLAERAREEGK